MVFERVVGLQIKDDEIYSQYRAAMMPLLREHGGGFRYDFKVSETLKNEEGRPINRVFLIYFADEAAGEAFFSNLEYKKIRETYFETSVAATTLISRYSRD